MIKYWCICRKYYLILNHLKCEMERKFNSFLTATGFPSKINSLELLKKIGTTNLALFYQVRRGLKYRDKSKDLQIWSRKSKYFWEKEERHSLGCFCRTRKNSWWPAVAAVSSKVITPLTGKEKQKNMKMYPQFNTFLLF